MANIPFTKEKVKGLDKGLHLTREVLGFNKEDGTFTTYPNRKQRRDNKYRPLQGLFIKSKQRVPIYTYYVLQKIKGVTGGSWKEVTKKEFDKTTLPTMIKFAGYKLVLHFQ